MSTISIRSVSKRFPNGFEALKGIDTEIASGSFTIILGPSGAGKSTLLRLMNGLENLTTGEVRIGDETVCREKFRSIRSRVAMVFQQFNLVDRLTVVTNVLTGRLAQRSWVGSVFYLFRKEDMDIAQDVLSRVDLQSLESRRQTVGRPATTRRHCARARATTQGHPGRRTGCQP